MGLDIISINACPVYFTKLLERSNMMGEEYVWEFFLHWNSYKNTKYRIDNIHGNILAISVGSECFPESNQHWKHRRLRILQPLSPSPFSIQSGLGPPLPLLQPSLYFVSIFKMQILQWTICVSWLFLWAKKPDFLQTLLNKIHRAQCKYLNKHDSTSFCSVIFLHLLSMSISLSSCLPCCWYETLKSSYLLILYDLLPLPLHSLLAYCDYNTEPIDDLVFTLSK